MWEKQIGNWKFHLVSVHTCFLSRSFSLLSLSAWKNELSQGRPGCNCSFWLWSERRRTLSSLSSFSLWFFSLTVIQDVDSSSLEGSYQSFASLMEQRLAELFLVAGRHGVRIKRATTVGGYTVQVDLSIMCSFVNAWFCPSKWTFSHVLG